MRTRSKVPATLLRLESELEELRRENQFRELHAIEGINLCSNDYLGLSRDPRMKDTVRRALQDGCPVSSTGSRLLSGHSDEWNALEMQLASFVGAEAAVFFSSGYLANVGLLTSVLGSRSTVFSAAANHASLIDGMRLSRARKIVFPHTDLDFLERALRASGSAGERFIVVESVFSMDGDYAPLEYLYTLADKYDACLIIDEAHATGVLGPNGGGLVAEKGRPDCVLATIHTCGKALASMGAFVACSDTLRQYLINKARSFIFSTALPPYIARQTAEAVSIVVEADSKRHYLAELSEHLRYSLRDGGFDTGRSESHIVPVILGSNEPALRLARGLVERGFGVKAIRPPTVPAGTARLRLSLTTAIDMEQASQLARCLVGLEPNGVR